MQGTVRHMGSLVSGHYISYCKQTTGLGKEEVNYTRFTRFECSLDFTLVSSVVFSGMNLMTRLFVKLKKNV